MERSCRFRSKTAPQPAPGLAFRRRRPRPSLPSLRSWSSCSHSSATSQPEAFRSPSTRISRRLADGDRVECCYAVRDRSRRPTKRGGEWLALKLADRTATVNAKSWDDVERALRRRRARHGRPRRRPLRAQPPVGRRADRRVDRAGRRRRVRPRATCSRRSPLPLERMEADLADLLETIQNEDLSLLLEPPDRTRRRALGAVPRRAGRQALPPGLPSRAARTHPLGRPGRQRRRLVLHRASIATSRSPAPSSTTSASSRPTTTTRWRST